MTRFELKCLWLIIFIFLAACVETDIYLPAFPDMMRHFDVSEGVIQSLLTWNFVGICLSGPFYGPLSDSFGRKKPLLVALGAFFLGSVLTLVAANFDQMLWGRILQGIGSGGCFTLGTAIIFDAFQKEKAMEAISRLNVIIPVVMAGAPLAGGYLNHQFGFRSNFLAIAAFVFCSLIVSLFFFSETHPKEKRSPFKMATIVRDFGRVFTSLPFWQLTVLMSFIFSGYIVFLSGTSVLFVVELGVSKVAFPLYQGMILAAWVGAGLVMKRVTLKVGSAKLKRMGMLLFSTGGGILAVATVIAPESPLLLSIGMIPFALGGNWLMSLYFPEGMEILPDVKGITASLLTSVRLLLSAFIIGISSVLYNQTIYPIAALVVGSIVGTILLVMAYERGKRVATAVVDL